VDFGHRTGTQMTRKQEWNNQIDEKRHKKYRKGGKRLIFNSREYDRIEMERKTIK
jgi:hypothetical protein